MGVNAARVQGQSAFLPGEACRRAARQLHLRRWTEATGVSRGHSTVSVKTGRAEGEGGQDLKRSRDEQAKQNDPGRVAAGRAARVKPAEPSLSVEPSPAQDKELSNAEGEPLWGRIWSRKNLNAALKRVEQNGGAPGIDGMRVHELRPYLQAHWSELRAQLDTEQYHPQPVRRVEIPKPDGGVRLLGIPTVLDRFFQQALQQVLTNEFEPRFSPHSYGFRPGRSAHEAVQQAQAYVEAGYGWVVDLDLDKFFDRVNHDMLMARVARVVKDKRVLRLIRRYLESGVMVNGVVMATEEGTPQGGPLSPLLANILLDDLDRELEQRGHKFVRYADDCNLYVKTPRAGERVLASVRRFVEQKLKLKVNEQKSKVDRPARTKILGFRLYRWKGGVRIGVAKRAKERCYDRLRELTRRTRAGRLADILREVNQQVQGWVSYFGLADTPTVFQGLDEWLRRRLRQLVWKRWKRGRTRWQGLVRLGVPPRMAGLGAVGKSPWHMAATPIVNMALSNAYWKEQGLQSAMETYHRLRIP
jgi:RNA-directed DNA polymerase